MTAPILTAEPTLAPEAAMSLIEHGKPSSDRHLVTLVKAGGRVIAIVLTGNRADIGERDLFRLADGYGLHGYWERDTTTDIPAFVQRYQAWDDVLSAFGADKEHDPLTMAGQHSAS